MMQVEIKDNKIFAPLLGKYLALNPEEKVRQEYICRLVNNYGFPLEQIAQDFVCNNNLNNRLKFSLLVWKNIKDKEKGEKPLIFIQCKSDSIIIRPEDFLIGIEYAKEIGADFFVATNSKQTKIYTKTFRTSTSSVDEILDIPNFIEAQNKNTVKELLNKTNEFIRDVFSKTLFKCHNIIRNNDKLSPEAAFDEISKVLFIKTLYERANKEGNIFSLDVYKREKKQYLESFVERNDLFYQELFRKVKSDLKDDDLFEPTEVIRIRENSFEAIIEELQMYNLSTTSDDVKGIAFEQFLGRTFRGELGQFFTPRTVVDFMVKVLDPEEGEMICDPCCGSGGFLIKSFEYVRAKIEEKIHNEKENIRKIYYDKTYKNKNEKEKEKIDKTVNNLFAQLNQELDLNNKEGRLRKLSYDCIFGTDANPRMSRTAKMNMIMHGDGHGGVHHNDGLLNVNGIFENRFDVILTNPPFGARVEKSLKISEADKYTDEARIIKYRQRYGKAYDEALKQVNNNIGKPLLSLYKTGSMSSLTEVLFIERCLNLLKPGGRLGIVLPEGVLNNTNLQKIRDYVEGVAKIILITSIPQDVFIASGATVKPSLLFFKKFTEVELKTYNHIVKTEKAEQSALYKLESEQIIKTFPEKPNAEQKKELKEKLKQLEAQLESKTKEKIKERFNYQIPIAEVEKAGISPTGAEIENELEPLEEEFTAYRKTNKLWENALEEVKYEIIDGNIFRMELGKPIEFYGK